MCTAYPTHLALSQWLCFWLSSPTAANPLTPEGWPASGYRSAPATCDHATFWSYGGVPCSLVPLLRLHQPIQLPVRLLRRRESLVRKHRNATVTTNDDV